MDNIGITSQLVLDTPVRSQTDAGAVEVRWPRLSELSLDPLELAGRRSFVGGSDANVIFSGDAERLRRLWQVKRGDVVAEELTGCLPVMLGCWSEASIGSGSSACPVTG